MAETLRKGSRGNLVRALQYIVGATADGIFGSGTQSAVVSWQREHGLTADGIVGANTWNKICATVPTLRVGATGHYVYALETLLTTLRLDGRYLDDEVAHVKTFQSANKLAVDGIVGQETWKRLLGITSVGHTSNGAGSVVSYKQYDSRWASVVYTRNNTYNRKQTIRNSGCGPTSMAMVVATFWDKSITPVQMASLAVAKGYRTDNSGTDWGFYKYVANKYGASKFVQTGTFATAKAALESGALVIVSVGPSRWTKGGHFIVWKGMSGNNVLINDPASAADNRAKAPQGDLRNAAKQYFCFWK